MRTLILIAVSSVVLASCTFGQKSPDYSVPANTGVPPDAKSQSGYDYPAMPLDQYNAQQSSGTKAPVKGI